MVRDNQHPIQGEYNVHSSTPLMSLFIVHAMAPELSTGLMSYRRVFQIEEVFQIRLTSADPDLLIKRGPKTFSGPAGLKFR